jgi:hypothetical protein
MPARGSLEDADCGAEVPGWSKVAIGLFLSVLGLWTLFIQFLLLLGFLKEVDSNEGGKGREQCGLPTRSFASCASQTPPPTPTNPTNAELMVPTRWLNAPEEMTFNSMRRRCEDCSSNREICVQRLPE